MTIPDHHMDIGYRIKCDKEYDKLLYEASPTGGWNRILMKTNWFAKFSSYGGARGVFDSAQSAKDSARTNGISKGTYEIWKFHIGDQTSAVPFFPPEKVHP